MSSVRTMIDAISAENFDGAKSALKASLAEYMAGKKYVSNEDVFGSDYTNPNDEEQDIKSELTESEEKFAVTCHTCMDIQKANLTEEEAEDYANSGNVCKSCGDHKLQVDSCKDVDCEE